MRRSLIVSTLLLASASVFAVTEPPMAKPGMAPSSQPAGHGDMKPGDMKPGDGMHPGAGMHDGMQMAPKPTAVGDAAPDFTLPDLGGTPTQLSMLTKEGPVVVIFLRGWVTYQCPLCTKQVGDFLEHADELKAAHARVLLVYPGPAADVKDKAKAFLDGKTLPESFALVTDADLATVKAYHVRWDAPKETAYPSTFVIDTGGKVTFAKVSHNHGDRASASDVLKALPKM